MKNNDLNYGHGWQRNITSVFYNFNKGWSVLFAQPIIQVGKNSNQNSVKRDERAFQTGVCGLHKKQWIQVMDAQS